MNRLLITPQAKADLFEIWHFIAKNNTEAARRISERLEQTLVRLSEMPGIGHARKDVKDPRYLFHPVGKYVIAYRKTETGILVVRVVHGARDFRNLFKEN